MRSLLRSFAVVALLAVAFPALSQAQNRQATPIIRTNSSSTISSNQNWLQSPEIQRGFPHLDRSYRVIASSTPRYNCISHSVGVTNHWIWPGDRVSNFDNLYSRYGYQRTSSMNFSHQPGVQKIALFAKVNGNSVECTHASRQEPNGGWSSKLGRGPGIWHPTPHSVSGPAYGKPIAIYPRSSSSR